MVELATYIASGWVILMTACIAVGVVLSVLGLIVKMIMEDPSK